MKTIIGILIIALISFGCTQSQNAILDKKENKVKEMNWLMNDHWTPGQTETAAGFYQITQYDESPEKQIKIIEERAAKNDLNARYAILAGKEMNELNEPLSFDKKFEIYKAYSQLAQSGQINAKVKLLNLYNNDEFKDGKKNYEILMKITELDGQRLREMINNFFNQTISAGRQGEIKDYIAFILNEQAYETEENTFSFDFYFKDLRSVKVLRNSKYKEEFTSKIENVFNQNHDGNLILFIMQFYTFDFKHNDLNKVCQYSNLLENTEYQNELVYKEIIKVLHKNNVSCQSKNNEIEFDKMKLNDWYRGWSL